MILSWEDILKVRVPLGQVQGSKEETGFYTDVSKRELAGAKILMAYEDAGKSVAKGKELLIKNLDYKPQEMKIVDVLYVDMAGGKWGQAWRNEKQKEVGFTI